ncbi:MAG: hypothetical protein M3O15_06575, partial [Acidobacteriota bacterium]|nr:hypothetical protein [Acidobacteriota bacterium]
MYRTVSRLFAPSALLAVALCCAAVPAHAGGPFQYHSVTPCRVFDTRQNSGQTTGSALTNPGPYNFRVQGNCGIPNGAQAVTLNATVVGPSAQGDLRLFPAGVTPPVVSTLNYAAGEPALANGAIVPLATVAGSGDKDLAVQIGMAGSGTVHVIVDVTG